MNNLINEKLYGNVSMSSIDGVEKERLKFIRDHIEDAHLKVLDIGCWDGTYASLYKKETNQVYGIESSNSAAKRAKKKGIIVQNGDFMEKNFFDGVKFDVIVAGEIIEHIYDTDLFLKKIYLKLKKGGKLIITTPNVASLPRRILLLLGKNPMLENRFIIGESVGHIRYFTFSDMQRLLTDNSFKILESKSDILNLNNKGTFSLKFIPRVHKEFGRGILIYAEK